MPRASLLAVGIPAAVVGTLHADTLLVDSVLGVVGGVAAVLSYLAVLRWVDRSREGTKAEQDGAPRRRNGDR